MTGSQLAPRVASARSRTTLVAFTLGLPLAAGVLGVVQFGPLRETPLRRYLSHPVEMVEITLFCVALAALTAKLLVYLGERRACRAAVLPPWDGKPVPVAEAGRLLAGLGKLPRRWQGTRIVKRAADVLDFLRSRGSAAELDDHLRTLADNDALALESSYALTRFICWAVPILGFLGTVLGITTAIAGVTPEVLEKSLGSVTDGLALAFDATALALGLTMLTMLLSFVVERAEQGVVEAVDQFADRELAHRFERTGSEGGEFVEVVRRHTDVLVKAMEKLVERQAGVWAKALEEVDRRRIEAERRHEERLTVALEAALEKTLEAHARRLAALEKQVVEQSAALVGQLGAVTAAVSDLGREQQAGLAQVARGLAAQLEAVARLQDGEKQLLRLHELLNQNLAALNGAAAFEEALHSLTAAVHLLTARATPGGSPLRLAPRPGAAA
jgi:biopolymer transport protein ExbB/TolQ